MLSLNVHAHVLQLDGVYLRGGPRDAPTALTFVPLPEPSAADVQALADAAALAIERALRAHGRYLEEQDGGADAEPDSLALEQPALAACYQASASGRALLGPEHGKPPLRLVQAQCAASTPQLSAARALCAQARGVNVHASAAVPGRDRPRLERLCRYAARPPLAQERLSECADGRLRLELKRPWADGTTAVLLSPDDLIARLCAAVPPPRFHLTRFAGVLAAHSTLRPLVVPKLTPEQPAQERDPAQLQLPLPAPPPTVTHTTAPAAIESQDKRSHNGRHPWALLLRHVFAVEVELCAHCNGRMRLVELCTTAEAIQRVLCHAGPGPPPRASPPRPPVHATQLRLPLHQGQGRADG